MKSHRTISPTVARRLAVTRQRLAGNSVHPDAAGILDVVRDLGCLQIDPISVVARTHLLVLWSRLGAYERVDLDRVIWQDRHLFEYWAHAASLVLTEDYPIHHYVMRRYPHRESGWHERVREWMDANAVLRDTILARLRAEGPLRSRDFLDESTRGWRTSGWNEGRNIGRMLDFLWTQGVIMVAGRNAQERIWDLADRCLPEWTPREELPPKEITRRAAQKSLRALGVARAADIKNHFTRGRYPELSAVLSELETERRIVRVEIREGEQIWPGAWYVHADDLPLIEQLSEGMWQPRTTLLSPFDNLICDRRRTELLFDFNYRVEIYVPKDKRQYGYYVLPILHGDRLIGRIDPTMDRKQERLTLHAVYAEPTAPATPETARAVAGAIESLAAFLGAREITYAGPVPEMWRPALG